MKRIVNLISILLLSHAISVQATDLKSIISDSKYKTLPIPEIISSPDGEYYAVANSSKTLILKCMYRTGAVVDTLFDVSRARSCTFKKFDGFEMSKDFKQILIYTDSERIYRHSFKANYYTFEIKRNLVKPLCDDGKQQIATFSPNGRMVAFVRDGNIYLKKLDYDSQSEVTRGGEIGKVVYGTTSWAYEEEFSCVNSLSWAPDNSTLAFLRSDESVVAPYKIQLFEGYCPSMQEYALYPGEFTYKYPLAGTDCSKVEVYTYTVESRVVKRMDVPMQSGGYIPRIVFTKDSLSLAVMTLNREQNILNIYSVNPKSGVARLLYKETSKTWVDEKTYSDVAFYDDFFVVPSMRDGYRHLYQYSSNGRLIRRLTAGKWDVTKFLGSDGKKTFFFQCNEEGAIYRSINKADLTGKITRLSTQQGYNTAWLNNAGTYYLNVYSNVSMPPTATINDKLGKTVATLLHNKTAVVEGVSSKEFFNFKNSEGIQLNGYMIKPLNFSQTEKYPVIMVQYSGPGSQRVLDKWEMPDWREYMVSQGYIVVCIDPRGTGGRGEAFSHCIYRRLGILESEDQVSAAKYLASLNYVDSSEISIYGWSYGGYISLMSLSAGRGIFKSCVAIAPITDWSFYDAIYTERYMNTPQANAGGYRESSPIQRVSATQGNILLVSGTADDNVHYQNTLQYSAALIEAEKQFEMQIYPNKNHSITGCQTRLHLFTRVCDFIKRNTTR